MFHMIVMRLKQIVWKMCLALLRDSICGDCGYIAVILNLGFF